MGPLFFMLLVRD